jgi:hypothetical protein
MARRNRLVSVLVAAVAGTGVLAASIGPAAASHAPGEVLHCSGEHFVMRPNAGEWGIRKVEGTNTKFVMVNYSVTAQVLPDGPTYGPFLTVKGNGNAHSNQMTEHCSFTELAEQIDDPFTPEVDKVDALFTIDLTMVRKP